MNIFFDSWDSVVRVIITLIVTYPALIVLLRIYGKRSLAKLNMFDFIITVALGSSLASVIISKDITVTDGIVILGMLLTAQYIVTKLSLKWEITERFIKSDPTIVFYDGEFVDDGMNFARVSKAEVLYAIRKQGIACLTAVHAVVLENNGELSVLQGSDNITRPTLRTVHNYEHVQ
jgi:uncharacterized membrane protein YcaP (DUF421 family)